MSVSTLTLPDAARMMREAMRDRTFELYPLGGDVTAYMRWKRKRLTKGSERKYEAVLALFALDHADLELRDFEPPVGTERVEEFMDRHWGHKAPRTYNSCLSPLKDFFKFHVGRGNLHGDPAAAVERARTRQPHRETFSTDEFRAIIAQQPALRDRVVLRLMLTYGLRKGEVRACQFKHFDHVRHLLTVFGKGGTVNPVPIPEEAFWHDLERLILDSGAKGEHYLMSGRRGNRHGSTLRPEVPISNHAMHDWWYRCLERAGVVAEGTTKGTRMHTARHTAGQRLLDSTGNLKAVQRMLRHSSLITTADTYVNWDLDQLAMSLTQMLEKEGGE